MANAWKVAAQSTPVAATLTDAYTVPALTQFVGVVNVANRSAVPTSLRISVAKDGAVDATSQYLDYDLPIQGNNSYERVVACDAADIIRVYATLATLTFTVMGVERT